MATFRKTHRRLTPSKSDQKDIALPHTSHQSQSISLQQQSSRLVTTPSSLEEVDQVAQLPTERVLSRLHDGRPGDSKDTADSLYKSGILKINQGKYEAAGALLKEAYDVLLAVYDVEVSLTNDSPGIVGVRKLSIMSDGYRFSSGLEFLRVGSVPTSAEKPETILDNIQAITDPNILYKIGLNLSRTKKYEEAIKYYQQAILLGGPNSAHYNAIAFNYYLLKDLEQAKEWCQKILDFTPAYGPAHATLSYIYQDEAEKARELGMVSEEREYFKKAIEELRISKKYEKVIIKSKESYRSNIEIGVAFLKSGNLESAQIYLKRAEAFLIDKQKPGDAPITPESVAQYDQHKKDLDYVRELQVCAMNVKATAAPSHYEVSSGSTASVSSDNILSPESKGLSVVRKAADGFRLGVSITVLRAEMKATKAAMDNMVRREEVSVAIARNEHEKHLIKQQAGINSDPKLTEYYDAFRSMLSITYASALAVEGGRVSLDTDSLFQRGVNMALGCIPLVGNALSVIAEIGEDLYNAAEIRKNAKLFLNIAPTIGEFEVIITQLASDVTLHTHKRDAILSFHAEPKVTGLLSKIIAKCKSIKASVDKALDGGELYKTDHAKLGVEDAMHVIERFLKYAAKLPAFANRDEVIKYLKHSLIPEEYWVLTQTDTSTIVHTHIVEHSPVGENVIDKTRALSMHQTSYDEVEYVERPFLAVPAAATPALGNVTYSEI